MVYCPFIITKFTRAKSKQNLLLLGAKNLCKTCVFVCVNILHRIHPLGGKANESPRRLNT